MKGTVLNRLMVLTLAGGLILTPAINANASIKTNNLTEISQNSNLIKISQTEAINLMKEIGAEEGNGMSRGATSNQYYLENYSGSLISKGPIHIARYTLTVDSWSVSAPIKGITMGLAGTIKANTKVNWYKNAKYKLSGNLVTVNPLGTIIGREPLPGTVTATLYERVPV